MLRIRLVLVLFTIVCLFSSCKKELESNVPETAKHYVDSFLDDAIQYGFDIDREMQNLDIIFTNIDDTLVDGKCDRSTNQILLDSVSWENNSDRLRKWLIYHELGHCILKREHSDVFFENGECKSIMASAMNSEICSTNFMSSSWEEYYIKELFTEESIIPQWYNPPPYDSIEYLNYFSIDTNIVEDRLEFSVASNLLASDFYVNLSFLNWKEIESCIHLKWGSSKSIIVCQSGGIEVRESFLNGQLFSTECYYKSDLKKDLEDITSINLIRKDGFYYIYVDGEFYHMMNYESINNNVIKTNSIDGLMNINISYGSVTF